MSEPEPIVEFSQLAVGDLVRITRVVEVADTFEGGFHARDAKQPNVLYRFYMDRGDTLGVQRLRKVRPPRPVEGDLINVDQLRATMWKRGTVISDRRGRRYMLTSDGFWRSEDDGDWQFDDFLNETLTVVSLP